MTNNIIQRFYSWLHSDEQVCFLNKGGWSYYYVRVERDSFFDLLYCQKNCSTGDKKANLLQVGQALKYAGIYCRKTDALYDLQFDLYDVFGIKEREGQKNLDALKREFIGKVKDQIIQILGDNPRSQLSVKELTTSAYVREYQEYSSYYAETTAREQFMKADDPYENQEFALIILLDDEMFTTERILSYILCPENIVQKIAKEYIESNQEQLLFRIMRREALEKEYNKILQDPDHELHIARKIQDAVKDPNIKNVNVTLDDQNGGTFTFKMEARGLIGDCKGGYCTIGMLNAKDEKTFFSFYGEFCYRFSPKDIVRIEYRRKTLYERED